MIIQRSLTIHNGCQHKHLHVDFNTGATYAVTGKNACGKTNMLQLNMYGLLGIVSKSWGSQKDLNMNGTSTGFVLVHLYDTDTKGDIYVQRHFTAGAKNPDRLWKSDMNHDPDIMGRDAVDLYLEGLFGVPMKILFELLWMRQGLSTWLLTASATSVYGFMNSIFDTSKFKKIREVLMDAANSIALYEVDIQRIDYLKSVISQLESKTYEDISQRVEQLKSLRESLSKLSSDCMSKHEKMIRMAELENSLKTQQGKITDIQSKIDGIGSDPAPWLQEEHYRFIESFEDIKRDLTAREVALEGKQFTVSQVENTVNGLRKGLELTHYDIGTLEGELTVYTSGPTCAFCGSHVNDRIKYNDAVSGAVIGTRKKRLEDQCTKLNIDIQTHEKDINDRMTEISALKSGIDQLKEYIAASENTRLAITEAIQKRQKWETAKATLPMAIDALNSAKVMEESIKTAIEKLKLVPVMEDDVEQTRSAIQAQISEVERLISSVNSQKIADTTMLNSCRSELATRITAQEKNEESQKMFNRIMRLREGAGNKRIPARYLADKVDMLNKELEAYCRMSDLDVTLFLDPEDFVFRFTSDTNVKAAGQLSGAQQTLCATILQLALIRVVSPQLGVIQMDEPTVFLDPVNRSKLLSLFESLSSVLSTTGTITLVPTHDVDLIGSCSDVITLGRG